MKKIGLVLLLTGMSASAATLPEPKMNAIANHLEAFKKDCAALAETKDISGLEIKNKTAESIDKKDLGEFVQKQLGLTTDPKSTFALNAVVVSSSSESKGVKKENFGLNLTLTKDGSELCKKSYSAVLTEVRKK